MHLQTWGKKKNPSYLVLNHILRYSRVQFIVFLKFCKIACALNHDQHPTYTFSGNF